MSYEAFGDGDDGHEDCFTEEQVKEHEEDARDAERARIILLIEKWRDSQVITEGDLVDAMSHSFTRASANEIIALIRSEAGPADDTTGKE